MVTVEIKINASLDKVWECWTSPEHIINWNFASDDWCCPSATNVLQHGKKFSWRMEAKDGSMGFDFTGTYDKIEERNSIEYHLDDGRKVLINFSKADDIVKLVETFETEDIHTIEQQRAGWQAILGNFKKYVEGSL